MFARVSGLSLPSDTPAIPRINRRANPNFDAARMAANENSQSRRDFRICYHNTPAQRRREESGIRSNIVIQHELIRMRAQADGVDFVRGLVFDPSLDHV